MNSFGMRERQMWNGSIIDPLRNESEVTRAVNKTIHDAMKKQNAFDYAVKQEKSDTKKRPAKKTKTNSCPILLIITWQKKGTNTNDYDKKKVQNCRKKDQITHTFCW